MSLAIDRFQFHRAEEILGYLGAAINDLQIYTSNHPRFKESAERIAELINGYFEKYPKSRLITFTVNQGQIEFQKVPLLGIGAQGERLMKILNAGGTEGLQLQRGITMEEVVVLISILLSRFKRSSPAPAESSENGDEKTAKFRFLSKAEAQRFVLDQPLNEHFPGTVGVEQGNISLDEGLCFPEFRVSKETCHSVLTTYRTLMSHLDEGRTFDFDTLQLATDEVIQLFADNPYAPLPAVSQTYFDDFTFHHSVNVCLITTAVAAIVVKDKQFLREISTASLLHDVGKAFVPAEILYKPERLTPDEFQLIQTHPVRGAEVLLGLGTIDPLSVAVAYGHHIYPGPGSYPRTRRPYHCDWVTQLVSVVDIYEALTAVRPYKQGLSSETAFRVMLDMPGLKNRLSIVKLLYDSLGPYPIGAIVELNTGERGMVVDRNPGFPYRPRVRVMTDEKLNPIPAPVDLDLAAVRETKSGRPLRIQRAIVLQDPLDHPFRGEARPEPKEILGSPLNDDSALMSREG